MAQARAYYNEHDPKIAAWLRQSILMGIVAPGDVDERSIVDVTPQDLYGYTQHHFFAGVGGWSFALRLAGWSDRRPVWTGSCPCQPFSTSGKQKGCADDRHLWPVWFNIIAACHPGVILGEQVASSAVLGKAGRTSKKPAIPVWFDGISDDLERARYTVGAADIPVASVGAPHIRQRLYWMAYADGGDASAERQQRGGKHRLFTAGGGSHGLANADEDRREGRGHAITGEGEAGLRLRSPDSSIASRLADREQSRLEGHLGDGNGGCEPGRLGEASTGSVAEGGISGGVGNAEGEREGSGAGGAGRDGGGGFGVDGAAPGGNSLDGGEAGGAGNAEGGGCGEQRDEAFEGDGGHVERAGGTGFDAWGDFDILPCRDNKARRVESGTFPLVDGLPKGTVYSRDPGVPFDAQATGEARMMRLHGYGNAINPRLASEFILACEEARTS